VRGNADAAVCRPKPGFALPYFEPPHRTAKVVGESLAWIALMSLAIYLVYLYSTH